MYSLLAVALLCGVLQGTIGYPQPESPDTFLDGRAKRAVPESSYFRKGEGVKVNLDLDTTTDISITTYPPEEQGLTDKKKPDTFNKNSFSELNSEKGSDAQKKKATPTEKKSEKKPTTTSEAPTTKPTTASPKEVPVTEQSPSQKESGFGILPDVFGIKPKLQKIPSLFGR